MKYNQQLSHFLLLILCVTLSINAASAQSDILDDLLSGGPAISDDGTQLLDNLNGITVRLRQGLANVLARGFGAFLGNVRSILDNLTNVLPNVRSRLKRATLQQAFDTLKGIDSSAELVERVLADAADKLNTNLHYKQVQQEWNKWTDTQLARANEGYGGDGETKKQVEDFINQLKDRYGSYLSSCYDSAEDLQTLIQYEMNKRVEGFQENLLALDAEITKCLQSGNNFIAEVQCSSAITSKLLPLKQLPPELNNLREGLQLMVRILVRAQGCVERNFYYLNGERKNIEQFFWATGK